MEIERDFETILRAAMRRDPDLQQWRFDGLTVTGVTPGHRPVEAPEWAPDRELTIELARRAMWLRASGGDIGRMLRERRIGAEVGRGWHPLLAAFDTMCREHGHPVERYSQIKEKFGSLRVYHQGDAYTSDLESTVALLSLCICELCGASGRRRNIDGWYATRCDGHVGAYA